MMPVAITMSVRVCECLFFTSMLYTAADDAPRACVTVIRMHNFIDMLLRVPRRTAERTANNAQWAKEQSANARLFYINLSIPLATSAPSLWPFYRDPFRRR